MRQTRKIRNQLVSFIQIELGKIDNIMKMLVLGPTEAHYLHI